MEDSKKGQSKWTDLHVSRETYDNTLRDSVNAFYEHSLNDPIVSQEHAVADTSQMAEEYFNAMDTFDNAQAESASTSISMEADSGIDIGDSFSIGSGISEGVDCGCDGSIGPLLFFIICS